MLANPVKSAISLTIISFMLGLGTGCSKSTTPAATSATSLSNSVGAVGITSPTAQSSSRATRRSGKISQLREASRAETDTLPTLEEVRDAIADTLATTTAANCFDGVSFSPYTTSASCYGPQLVFEGDSGPGGTCQGITVNAPATCLPTGDLGIWSATDTGGEACSAAQMNALTGGVAVLVNNGIQLMAALACVGTAAGKSLPSAVGETVTLTSDVTSAVATAVAAPTTAIVTRLADYSGTSNPVYQTNYVGTIGTVTVDLTLKHSPNTNGADFSGILYGTISTTGGNVKGFSVVYDQTSGTLKFLGKSATTAAPTTTTDLFDDEGNYEFTTFNSSGSDGRYLLGSVDSTSGLGTMKFAWQAGGMDKKARVFHISTSAGASDTGFAYFSYGPNFSSASVGDMTGMCCRWAGHSNQCMADTTTFDLLNKGQNQTFTRNGSGVFTPDSSAITYAPTITCDDAASNGYKWGTGTEWGVDGSAVTDGAVTNNLSTFTAVGTIPSITAPSFSP